MKLLIDIGNSRIKWAYANASLLSGVGSATYQWPFAHSWWANALPLGDVPDQVIIASVAGAELNTSLEQWLADTWTVERVFLASAACSLGVTNAYREPEKLGVDRWAAMLAAHAQVRGAVCVVDCGTAVTLDIVNAAGVHQGGMILPGRYMMRQALHARTSRIPLTDAVEQHSLLGTDTDSCISAAGLQATLGMIERAQRQYTQETGEAAVCVLTGGDAKVYLKHLSPECRHEPDLVLKGIHLLSEEHR